MAKDASGDEPQPPATVAAVMKTPGLLRVAVVSLDLRQEASSEESRRPWSSRGLLSDLFGKELLAGFNSKARRMTW